MYIFLTACRNESLTMPAFLAEFAAMLEEAGIKEQSKLYVVDDLSTDDTVAILRGATGTDVNVILAPTNLGNQGAMFYGLRRLQVGPDDLLITLDSDGEDDVAQVPSVIALAAANPGKAVLIERGRRKESLKFKVMFTGYKMIFRSLTRQTVVPNNFMVLPGRLVPSIQAAPLAAVHFAYAVLKLRPSYVTTKRDRRSRYAGNSSQNMFMLVSHGLVGLMVFFEVLVAKIFMLLFGFGVFSVAVVGLAIALPAGWLSIQRTLVWTAIAAGIGAVGMFGLLLSAALALVLKLAAFTLAQSAVAEPARPTRPLEGGRALQASARDKRSDAEAS
jgi:glycosyltransferase involved in cell wall biosynthesis